MNETDDRLTGDVVWELFAAPVHSSAKAADRVRRFQFGTVAAGIVGLAWFFSPAGAVVIACLSLAATDVRRGWELSRSIPDKAGGTVCARFSYAWGAWKLGLGSFVLMLLSSGLYGPPKGGLEVYPAIIALMLLCLGGFTLSAALTALGLIAAFRSGMRVWIGEGVNRAGTLLLGMLIVGFVYAMLLPTCVWLAGRFPRAGESRDDLLWPLLVFFGYMIGGPVAILVALDALSRRVIADRPGKFGPKVPTVGKWNV
jgi:hypothetical protein